MSDVKTIHFAFDSKLNVGFVRLEDEEGRVWLAEADGVADKQEVLDDLENGEFDYLLEMVPADLQHHVDGWGAEHPNAELIYGA